MPVLIGKRMDRFGESALQHIIDIQDVQPGQTRIVEVETDLLYSQENQFVYYDGMSLPNHLDFRKKWKDVPPDANFAEPGLVVEWAELEGPIDCELGRQRFYGDLEILPKKFEVDLAAGKPVTEDWKRWPLEGKEFKVWPLVPISKDPRGDADRLIRAFLPRAIRAQVSEDIAAHYVKLVQEQLERGDRFEDAMRDGYVAILCSPFFLFYQEKPGRLDDYAVAARLARFLWSSLPDDELMALAEKNELSKPDVLRAQTERLLNDRKARRFSKHFTDQWLSLGKFMDMKPDDLYVEYDPLLAWSIPLESHKFFEEVLDKDLPTSSFVNSDWTFLNERLAQHYGIPGVRGNELRRVALPPESHRGGVITQAGVLKMTTNASYTSPIKRGAWLLDRILGQPPAPPPPNVAAADPDIRGAVTIREQLEKHKTSAVCSSCHSQIDPHGFALENFDVLGGWRDRYRVKKKEIESVDRVELANYPGKMVNLACAVDASGTTADGRSFKNIDDYKQLLLQDPDQLTRNLAQKLIIYSTGAEIQFADREVVEQIVRDVKSKNHGFRSLVHAVVQSRVFLAK